MGQGKTEIEKLFETFIQERGDIGQLRPETLRGYNHVFHTLLKIVPDIRTPGDINYSNLLEFFHLLQTRKRKVGNRMEQTGVQKSTVFTYQGKLKLFFDWLKTHNYISESPLDKMTKCSHPVYEDRRYLNGEEVRKILAAISSNPNKSSISQKRDLAMIYALLFCGVRSNELRQLEVRDVNLGTKTLTVRGITSKSGRNRYIPIHPVLSVYLKDYLKERHVRGYKTPSLWISGRGDRDFSAQGLKHWTNRLKKLSGVNCHLHRFRHTFARNFIKGHEDPTELQELLGHKSLKMTFTYLRGPATPENLREGIDKMSIDGML